MALEVIGAGLGRTGTMSLKVALEKLGYGPCYHMVEVFKNPDHVPLWEAAAAGRSVEWDRIFGGYRASVDYPGADFYGELLRRYPDARVILTTRDPERWYASVRSTIYEARDAYRSPLLNLVGRVVPPLGAVLRAGRMADRLIFEGDFGGRFGDRAHALEVFRRHNEGVRRRVPEDRLLVYEVTQGWEPLCRFLGVPVPDEPFPRLNDAAVFRRRILALRVGSAVAVALPAVPVAYYLFRRLRSTGRRET